MHTAHLHPGETQRPIPKWPGYYVSDAGRVFSFKVQGFQESTVDLCKPPLVLQVVGLVTRKQLRPVVPLREGRKRRWAAPLGTLVLLAFVGPRPPGLLMCHWNDDAWDNRLSNLRWDTPKANCADAKRNGRMPVRTNRRFTLVQASCVRRSSWTVARLAAHYGVSRSAIESIKHGRTYREAVGLSRYTWSGRGRRPTVGQERVKSGL